MNHCIEINTLNNINAAPWAEKLTTRLEEECNNWTPSNTSPDAMPKQNASIFKLSHRDDVDELCKIAAVAIGPYHRQGNNNLSFSDAEKRDIVMLLSRIFGLDFKRFFCMVSPKINEVRACYADGCFDLDDEALSEMLLFDSGFIICAIIAITPGLLFGATWMRRIDREEDSIRKACKSLLNKFNQKAREVISDLLMLDNQIPYFLVEIVWEYCFEDTIFDEYSFEDAAQCCFDDLYPKRSKSRIPTSRFLDCQHLLDLYHWSRIPEDRFRERANYSQPGLYISTATELQASSVIFKKRTSDCFLDIQFSQKFFKTKGVISIPEIHLYPYSHRIFQNLVAFEQAYGLRGYGFTGYVECMAQLLQTENDVSILRSSGIIASTPMTDREVIDFFQTIQAGVQVDEMPDDLYMLYDQVKDHIKQRPCFPNKWITISVFSVSLFVLSSLQAFYAVITYYDPKSTN